MPRYAALLRGVNVGGNNKVPMSDLRKALDQAGFADVATLLQSGNVVLSSSTAADQVKAQVERTIEHTFGLKIEVVVRSPGEMNDLIAGNPFPKEAEADPSHLLVLFTRQPVSPHAAASLQAKIKGPELIRAAAGHAIIYYPAGVGKSTLTPKVVEAHLGPGGTARNWNTVLKLASLLQA